MHTHLRFSIYAIVLLLGFTVQAQDRVGLLTYDINRTYEGYTLIYPHNQPTVWLLDNCGEVVHSWPDSTQFRPGNTAYLLPDGRLVKTKRPASIVDDAIWAGGGGATIEIRTWDNELEWSFTLNNDTARLHHDIEVLPNGNILALAWELIPNQEAINAGRDPGKLNQTNLWPDYLFEIDPTTDEIVWEWHAWDHLIQDFDDTKPNFGVISENQRRIDVNLDFNDAGGADWMHANFIDYNAELDHVMICVPYFSEVWIIDHSTTTAQAATNRGGNANRGGDLLYRIGNRAAYGRGDADDQLLFFPHNAHWANEFLPPNHPFAGNLVCYNNRVGDDFSTVEVFETAYNMYIRDYELVAGVFPPLELENTISHPTPQAIFSTGLSSAQLLPNGNVLICAGRKGYLVELTPENEIVWEYKVPFDGGQPVDLMTNLEDNDNLTFMAFRYPPEYSAFTDRDLSSKGFLELNPQEDYCEILTPVSAPQVQMLKLWPNAASEQVQLTWESAGEAIEIRIYDLNGRLRQQHTARGGRHYMDVSNLESGLYLVSLNGEVVQKLVIE